MIVCMFAKARPMAAGLVLACAAAACGGGYDATGPVGGPLASGNDAANSVQDGRTLFSLYDYGHNPGQVTIPVGTVVEWRNVGATSHSVSNYSTHPQAATWDDALVDPGETFEFAIDVDRTMGGGPGQKQVMGHAFAGTRFTVNFEGLTVRR